MTVNEFMSQFGVPERSVKKKAAAVKEEEVLLFACVLAAGKEKCCVLINGVEYEIATDDIVDISPTTEPEKKESSKSKGKAEIKEEAAQEPQLAQLRLKSCTRLQRRIEVSAVELAAMGTWVWAVWPSQVETQTGC